MSATKTKRPAKRATRRATRRPAKRTKKTAGPPPLPEIDPKRFERCGKLGVSLSDMACLLQVTREQLERLLELPVNAEAVERGRLKADANCVRALYLRATEGDVGALRLWLVNRQPERWGRYVAKSRADAGAAAGLSPDATEPPVETEAAGADDSRPVDRPANPGDPFRGFQLVRAE